MLLSTEKCNGGSSFSQLGPLEKLHINNGSVLVNGKLTWPWINILFWRAFLALVCHYMSILLMGSLSLKLGVITNVIIETKI